MTTLSLTDRLADAPMPSRPAGQSVIEYRRALTVAQRKRMQVVMAAMGLRDERNFIERYIPRVRVDA